MAFVDPTQPGEDENEQNPSQVDQVLKPSDSQSSQQQSQSQQTPPSTSGGGAGVAAGGGGSGAGATGSPAPAAPKPSSSGSWTNLDSYLGANSDQATQLGQQIASNVNSAGTQAQTDINNLGTSFTNSVNQNVVNQNPDAVNKAITDASSLTAGQNLSSDDQQAYNQQANASYSGPTDVTAYNGYNQASQDVLGATQKAQETTSEAGRGTLLNDQFGNSSQYGYNQGENNLDQLLLQNSEGAQTALQPLAQQWSGLNGALNNTVATGAGQVQQAQTTDATTSTAAQNALNTENQSFENELTSGLSNLQATDTASYNKLMSDLQAGTVSNDEWASLGITPGSNYIYSGGAIPAGTNQPSMQSQMPTYLSQGNVNQDTIANYATADQYAQAQALAELAGQGTSSILSPSTIAQAGTAETAPAYNFNNAMYNSDNSTAQTEYNNAIGSTVNNIRNWQGANNFQNQMPITDIKSALAYLQNLIDTMGTDPNFQGAVTWAKQQFAALNQVQQSYNQSPFAWKSNVNTAPVLQ